MKIRVLGSAAGGGLPQWNCNCPNCDGFRKGTIQIRRRTQSSIAVSSDSVNWVLFNASPDILTQLDESRGLQPGRAIRDTGIRAVVLIDAQIDHTTGLLMLRESKEPLRLYCTDPVNEDLTTGNPLFNVLSHYCKVDRQPVRFTPSKNGGKNGDKFEFQVPGVNDLRFTAYPLKSNAPPYSPHRNNYHVGDTIGVVVEDLKTGKKLFYSPGLGEIEDHLPPLMRDADCLMVDGTFWKDDEMIQMGLSKKHSREIGHLPQSGPGGMMQVLAPFQKPRKILIHINNTNPILNENSPERAELARAKIEVAFDGMEIEL
jgi:pyrroloquinoline quinone biosynthesis protein B